MCFLEVLLPRRHRLHDFESDLRCCPRIALQVRLQALRGSRSKKGGQLLAVKNCHQAVSLLLDIARLSLEILSWPHGNRFSTSFLSVCLRYTANFTLESLERNTCTWSAAITGTVLSIKTSLGLKFGIWAFPAHPRLSWDYLWRWWQAAGSASQVEQTLDWLVEHTRMIHVEMLDPRRSGGSHFIIYLHFHSSCILHIHSINSNFFIRHYRYLFSTGQIELQNPFTIQMISSREFGVFQIRETFLPITDWRRDSGEFWHDLDFSETAMDTSGETARNLVILLQSH